jgi:hypothetical protein
VCSQHCPAIGVTDHATAGLHYVTSRHRPGDETAAPAAALLAAALGGVHTLAAAYGAALVPLVRACPTKPAYGSAAEGAALVARCLAFQE